VFQQQFQCLGGCENDEHTTEPVKRFGKDIDINKSIKELYDEVKKYKIDDIICIDETSIKSL
jgi:hypothetical protein